MLRFTALVLRVVLNNTTTLVRLRLEMKYTRTRFILNEVKT